MKEKIYPPNIERLLRENDDLAEYFLGEDPKKKKSNWRSIGIKCPQCGGDIVQLGYRGGKQRCENECILSEDQVNQVLREQGALDTHEMRRLRQGNGRFG